MCDVLVIEDDLEIQRLLAEILSDQGFFVRQACSLEQARAILADLPNDPVLLVDHDLGQPDQVSGFEFAREYVAASANGRAIYMTASWTNYGPLTPSARERHLPKPFRLAELLGSMQEMLVA